MGKRLDIITQQRLDKVRKLRERGINPYPNTYHRTHTAQEARSLFESAAADAQPAVSVAGRITALRQMGKATFLDLRDGSGKIQAYFNKDQLGPERHELVKDLDLGDFIGVEGALFRTRTGEITVEVSDFTMLAKSLQPLPEKWHGLADVEKRYRQRYLDLIANPEVRDIFLVRSQHHLAPYASSSTGAASSRWRRRCCSRSAGGALARPFITHHNALDQDFYLRIALELHLKRLIVGGFDKVYEIGRIFRNEGIAPPTQPRVHHAGELRGLRRLQRRHGDGGGDGRPTSPRRYWAPPRSTYGDLSIDLTPPWQRLTLRDAVLEYVRHRLRVTLTPARQSLRGKMQAEGLAARSETELGASWSTSSSPRYVEPKLIQPTFLIDYPVEMSPLAKTRSRTTSAWWSASRPSPVGMEIANAFTELNDPLEQRQRFDVQEQWRASSGTKRRSRSTRTSSGAGVRHAAHRRAGRGHRPPGDAAHQPAVDPRGHPVPAAQDA